MPLTLQEKKLFAFDLDGTLYFGDKIAEGASELVSSLQQVGQVVFFTNNSSKTNAEIHAKLVKLGIACNLEEVYATSTTTAMYLHDEQINNVYVVGSKGFKEEISACGVQVVENGNADHLVVGLDFAFNYETISQALTVLLKGGKFIVCNEDASFPVENNQSKPGCGAMVGAIAYAAQRKPDFIVGKPNTYILSKIAKTYGVNQEAIVVVGDSYESDIQMALNFQCQSILIGKSDQCIDMSVMQVDVLSDILQFITGN